MLLAGHSQPRNCRLSAATGTYGSHRLKSFLLRDPPRHVVRLASKQENDDQDDQQQTETAAVNVEGGSQVKTASSENDDKEDQKQN